MDSDGSGASLGARRLFRPLCRKCPKPLFKAYHFSPTNFTPQQALSGRAGLGEDGSSDTERSKAGSNGRVEGQWVGVGVS